MSAYVTEAIEEKMIEIKANLKFQCPFGCIVSGPSMSGKSCFIMEAIIRTEDILDPPPDVIVYAYGSWQDAFDRLHGLSLCRGWMNYPGIILTTN